MIEAYRAMRYYSRSLEALAALAETVPAVGRYLLEPALRDDPALLQRLAGPAHPDSGTFHFDNETSGSEAGSRCSCRLGTMRPGRRRWSWRCMADPGMGGCSCGTGWRKLGRAA